MARIRKKFRLTPKYLAVALITTIIILGSLWYLSRPFRKSNVTIPSTANTGSKSQQNNNQQEPGSGSASNSSTPPASTKSNTGGSSPNSSTPLLEPWGNFVSNHGQDVTPTAETSVCNTTPGATCYIKFTKDSQVRTLETKTTDSNGSAIWDWDVQGAGFSSGSWQITAVATLNGQTKTATDPQLLVIQ